MEPTIGTLLETTLEEQTKSTEIVPPDPRDSMAFWERELSAAEKRVADWHKQSVEIVKRFLDEDHKEGEFRLNLFHSNIKTQEALLYSNLPRVRVSRRHLDAKDDAARIAATLVERILNNDVQANGTERDAVLKSVLQDRLLCGLGCARVRYTFDTEQTPMIDPMSGMPAIDPLTFEPLMTEKVVNEQAPIDYYYWQDVLWGWSRSWAEIPWFAYRSYLSKMEVAERFPGHEDKVTYSAQPTGEEQGDTDKEQDSPHNKAEIWEIWDKASLCVKWFHKKCPELLDVKDDPLQLTGFFPSPPCLIANPTTMLYKPVPDFSLDQDLYNEIDCLQTRISIITTAVRVVGLYDANADGVERMLKEGYENALIPVESWAMFAEKGGIRGAVDWFPLEAVVAALNQLIQIRNDTIGLLQRVTGQSDTMAGSVNPYEGVGQTEQKLAWGSSRLQAMQDQFASFVSDLLQLQSEVIFRHFDPQTIAERSNLQFMEEPQENMQAAMELLASPKRSIMRVDVKSEAVAQVDQGRVQAERAEFLNALSTFMQSTGPMMTEKPETTPYLLQMLQWVLSGFRGAAEIEGVLDKAIAESMATQQQPKEDPAQQAAMQAAQMEMQKIQAKAQADMQVRQHDLQADIQEILANNEARLKEIMASHQSKMAEIQAAGEAKLVLERIGLEANIAQNTQFAMNETDKDIIHMQAERDIKGPAK